MSAIENCLNCAIDNSQCYECYILSGDEARDIQNRIYELEQWVRENQAKGSDEVFIKNINELHALREFKQ